MFFITGITDGDPVEEEQTLTGSEEYLEDNSIGRLHPSQ